MKAYQFDEHGKGYRVGKTLQLFRPEFSLIVPLIPEKSKVLDVGCGDGVLGKLLIQKKQCTLYGCDLDKIGVKESLRKGVKAVVADANSKLPYVTNSFDTVICNTVLEFIEKPNELVEELFRVTKKDVIISFPNFGFWVYRLQMLFGRFPQLSLFGHEWHNTRMIKFFSLTDFLLLPALRNKKLEKVIGINWANRKESFLAKIFPNFFSRACILVFTKL